MQPRHEHRPTIRASPPPCQDWLYLSNANETTCTCQAPRGHRKRSSILLYHRYLRRRRLRTGILLPSEAIPPFELALPPSVYEAGEEAPWLSTSRSSTAQAPSSSEPCGFGLVSRGSLPIRQKRTADFLLPARPTRSRPRHAATSAPHTAIFGERLRPILPPTVVRWLVDRYMVSQNVVHQGLTAGAERYRPMSSMYSIP